MFSLRKLVSRVHTASGDRQVALQRTLAGVLLPRDFGKRAAERIEAAGATSTASGIRPVHLGEEGSDVHYIGPHGQDGTSWQPCRDSIAANNEYVDIERLDREELDED